MTIRVIIKIISKKIVITKFDKKITKSSFMFSSEIKVIKDVCKKHRNRTIIKVDYRTNIKVESFKISNSDSLGVKLSI